MPMLKTIAIAALFAAAPALAQVLDSPEAKRRAESVNATQNVKIVAAAAIAYIIRDSRDLCGFKLTAFAEHMIDSAVEFATVEQKAQAEIVALNTRPHKPLADFCNSIRDEFKHAHAKWFAD